MRNIFLAAAFALATLFVIWTLLTLLIYLILL